MAKISVAGGATNAADPDAQPERADRTYPPGSVDELAERAYCAYADALGWREYATGEPMGDWSDNDDDEHAAWRAVAVDLRRCFLEPGGVQPPKRAPRDETDEPVPVGVITDESGKVLNVDLRDDSGAPYPEDGTAGAVEAWVAGNTDRARYALAREDERPGGPRAGLSASLRKLVPDDSAGNG